MPDRSKSPPDPRLAVLPGTSWSYSKLSAFQQCPWRWLRIYVYGEFEEDSRATAIGRLTHVALGQLIRARVAGQEDVSPAGITGSVAGAYEAEPQAAALAGDAEAWSEITELVTAGIMHLPYAEQGAEVAVEQEIRVDLAPSVVGLTEGSGADLLTATLDVCMVMPDRVRIIDWKTDRRPYAIGDKRQLPLYGGLARRVFGRPVEAELRFLRTGGDPVGPRHQEQWRSLMDDAARWAVSTIKAIRAAAAEGEAVFTPKPGPLCRYCHVRAKCPALQGIGARQEAAGGAGSASPAAPQALDRAVEAWTEQDARQVGEYLLVLSSATDRVRDLVKAYARDKGPIALSGGHWSLDPRTKTVWKDVDGAIQVLRGIGARLDRIVTLSSDGLRPLLARAEIRDKLQPFFESKPNGSVLAFHAAGPAPAGGGKRAAQAVAPAADAGGAKQEPAAGASDQ